MNIQLLDLSKYKQFVRWDQMHGGYKRNERHFI